MTSRTLYVIGLGQLVNWGVLFFAFGVLLVPVEQALDAPRWLVAGAFSVSLLISAIAAPVIGRLADRGQGPVVMQAGGFIAAGLLIVWAAAPTLVITYVVWAALGVCMAAILYEPVFAIIGRAFTDGDARFHPATPSPRRGDAALRAIATVTITGGLASTAFLPGTTFLVTELGWRGAVMALAVLIAISTFIVTRIAFKDVTFSVPQLRDAISRRADRAMLSSGSLNRLVAVFALASIANSALASNIVAALIERQLSAERAAAIGGLLGVMQLPGRAMMMNRSFSPSPLQLLMASFALQIAGLLALTANAQAAMWIGVSLFACGAGLTTLARPYLVLQVYGAERAGSINGVIARAQQLARAAGPVSAAAIASIAGYGRVFAGMAVLLGVAIALAWTDDHP
jgi:MFS family permease